MLDEFQSGTVSRSYAWGLQQVSETQLTAPTPPASSWSTSYYGFDGHGSVRYLTDATGAVTDTYDYDAFGNLIDSTGSTPNNYLFAGEQLDPDLGLYYNRARYLDTRAGRFWGMDTDEGRSNDPASLHKYFYASANPVNRSDPSGNDDIASLGVDEAMLGTLSAMPSFGTQLIARGQSYPVVVVTMPSGGSYTPQTAVKNPAQATASGFPYGWPIRIAVPDGIDPQALVDKWRGASRDGESPQYPQTWIDFAQFWWPGGENDFKVRDGVIYDAFGNFEYGATGAAAGFSLDTLLSIADTLHVWQNNLINENDILDGFLAVDRGGTLSVSRERLSP